MASISASGTGSAAPIAASAASCTRIALALLLATSGTSAAEASTTAGTLDVTVDGLRSAAGTLRICLTTRPDRFPDCQADPQARRASVPAATPVIRFADLPSGSYAIAVIHDENDNRRLDRRFGIPTEGIGFSRNPRLYFGPPAFKAASFELGSGERREVVRIKYFL